MSDEAVFRSIFVGKNGNDGNAGTSPDAPKLTITAGLAAAAAMGPAAADPVVVHVLDAGTYTESFAGLPFVRLSGPWAKVVGSITLPPDFYVNLDQVEQSGAGVIALLRTGAAGTSLVTLNRLICHDTVLGLVCIGAGNVVIMDCQQVFVEDGIGVGDAGVGTGHIHFEIEDLYLTGGASPIGVARAGAGITVGRATHILNVGASVTATGIVVFSGQIDMAVRYMDPPAAFSVAAAAALGLDVGSIAVGSTRTVAAGGVLQLSEGKANNFAAAAPPGAGDDETGGYRQGSVWYDGVGGVLYTCVDPTTGAAVWV